MPDEDDDILEPEKPSKTQRKREMQELRDMGERLLTIPEDGLKQISSQALIDAVHTCKKIHKGSARKRQVTYIGKLLRSDLADEVRELIDRFDASSQAHVAKFHQLEVWREGLMNEDQRVLEEVFAAIPHIDRQQLRQLVRNAIAERKQDREPPVHFRKLFQYLKSFE